MVESEIERTVFVCGTGRSGTTIVQVALDANDGFAAFGELESRFTVSYGGLIDLFRALGRDFGVDRSVEAIRLFRYVMRELAVGGLYGDLGLDTHLPDGHYWQTIDRFLAGFGDQVPRYLSDRELILRMRGFLTDLVAPILGPDDRWVDGTPHTLMQAQFLVDLLPGAQFLHVSRDPRAVAVSLMRQVWAPNDVEGCGDWLESVYSRLQAEIQTLDRSSYLHIRFEDLCTDPVKSTRLIGEFLGAPSLTFAMVEFESAHANKWVESISDEDSNYLVERFDQVYDWLGYERDLGWWRDRMTPPVA